MGNPAGYVPETLVSDGVTTHLPFPFQTYDKTTVKVKVIAQTTGVYSDATVTSVDVIAGTAGGYANISAAATAGDTYVIYDDAPYSQTLNIQATGDLRNDLWIKAIDKLSRQIQIISDESRRSIKFAIGETTVDGTFDGTVTAGRALVINDAADGITISDTDIDDLDTALATAEAQALAAAASASSASGSASTATTQAGIATTQAGIATAAAGAFTLASQAEAEAGTENTKFMSALRVAQAIDAQIPISTDGTLAGNSDTVVPSQKAVKTYADGKYQKIELLSTDPASPANGQIWINTSV